MHYILHPPPSNSIPNPAPELPLQNYAFTPHPLVPFIKTELHSASIIAQSQSPPPDPAPLPNPVSIWQHSKLFHHWAFREKGGLLLCLRVYSGFLRSHTEARAIRSVHRAESLNLNLSLLLIGWVWMIFTDNTNTASRLTSESLERRWGKMLSLAAAQWY